jgi:hypothetical protein
MARVSIDITGAGPHVIFTPTASEYFLARELFLTFAHASPTSLRVWFWSASNLVAGPYYVTDGGQIRYKSSDSQNTYKYGPGESFEITLDPGLSAAGAVDFEIGAQ